MDRRRTRTLALALVVLGGVVAFLSATELFPYRSLNHDEGVYLQQAAMLLEGQLYFRPPVPEAMRPWFFVVSEAGMYPKYAPVAAAVFALGELLWSYELALVAVGAALVALTYDVSARTFGDRRVGLLAGAALLCSPLFVVQVGTFLPYAPTTVLNLAFAAAFLRADDRESIRWGGVAGVCIGLAFFARPYTAVLFALPFILAALADLAADFRNALPRHGATAVLGLCGVGLALGYNAVVTGDPFTFPYAAFAPRDGLGFGQRRLLGHEVNYTPELALESNALAVETLLTDWTAAGLLGTALAAVGALVSLVRARRRPSRGPALVAGVLCSVLAGNLYFWGTYNTLGALGDPNDGLVNFLGPYYHFDSLLPLSAFAAVGALALGGWARRRADYWLDGHRRAVLLSALLLSGAVFGVAAAGALAEPLDENGTVTAEYRAAYEPIEAEDPGEAVVFLPDTYGPWLNHPFQHLRNDPDFDSGQVYALDYDEENFAVLDAFPDREIHRFGYRGVWNPTDGAPVTSVLQPVETADGERATHRMRVGLPERADAVSVRLGVEGDEARYYSVNTTDELPLELSLTDGNATLSGPVRGGERSVPLSGTSEVELSVFVDRAPGNRLTYRFTVPVATGNGTVRTLTPEVEACRIAPRCGGAAAYVPNESGLPPWASVETDLTAQNGSADRTRSRTQTRTMERAMSRPPVSGSSVVSPRRSPYSMGTSRTS